MKVNKEVILNPVIDLSSGNGYWFYNSKYELYFVGVKDIKHNYHCRYFEKYDSTDLVQIFSDTELLNVLKQCMMNAEDSSNKIIIYTSNAKFTSILNLKYSEGFCFFKIIDYDKIKEYSCGGNIQVNKYEKVINNYPVINIYDNDNMFSHWHKNTLKDSVVETLLKLIR